MLAKVAKMLVGGLRFLCDDVFPPNVSSNLRKAEQLRRFKTRTIRQQLILRNLLKRIATLYRKDTQAV